jgi:hypothetical protein
MQALKRKELPVRKAPLSQVLFKVYVVLYIPSCLFRSMPWIHNMHPPSLIGRHSKDQKVFVDILTYPRTSSKTYIFNPPTKLPFNDRSVTACSVA